MKNNDTAFFTRSNHSVSWWRMLSELPIQYVEFQGRTKPVGGKRIIVPRSEIGHVVSRTAQNNEESNWPSYVCRRKLRGNGCTRPRGLGSNQLKRRVELIREMTSRTNPSPLCRASKPNWNNWPCSSLPLDEEFSPIMQEQQLTSHVPSSCSTAAWTTLVAKRVSRARCRNAPQNVGQVIPMDDVAPGCGGPACWCPGPGSARHCFSSGTKGENR